MCSTSGSDCVTMQGKRPEECACYVCTTLCSPPWKYTDIILIVYVNLNCQSGCFLYSQNRILNLHYLSVIFTRFSRILIRSESDSKWWSDLFWFWSDQKSHSLFSCPVSSYLHCLSSAQQVLWSHHCPAEKTICCLCLNDLWRSLQVGLGGFHISDKTLRWGKHLKLWMWHPRYSWVWYFGWEWGSN